MQEQYIINYISWAVLTDLLLNWKEKEFNIRKENLEWAISQLISDWYIKLD